MRTITWNGTLTALSSVAHGGETRGTITLLRREQIAQPDGAVVQVPIVSGNTLRGRLRRIGEELLRDVLQYEGQLSPAAAHALRGGGALAKTTGEPLSGNRLQALRNLCPQIGVFGAAASGTIIDGALDVGKVVPHLVETNHITGAKTTASAFTSTQLEAYTRQDDGSTHDFVAVITPTQALNDTKLFADLSKPAANQQMLFHIETFPAGTTFSTWLRLRRPTDLEAAFFCDVLAEYVADGRLGGRVGTGHGQTRVELTPTREPDQCLPNWREHLLTNREQVMASLRNLT